MSDKEFFDWFRLRISESFGQTGQFVLDEVDRVLESGVETENETKYGVDYSIKPIQSEVEKIRVYLDVFEASIVHLYEMNASVQEYLQKFDIHDVRIQFDKIKRLPLLDGRSLEMLESEIQNIRRLLTDAEGGR